MEFCYEMECLNLTIIIIIMSVFSYILHSVLNSPKSRNCFIDNGDGENFA